MAGEAKSALAEALERVDSVNLYVHIPFCIKPCTFCRFTRFAYEPTTYRNYMKALVAELEEYVHLAGQGGIGLHRRGAPTVNHEAFLSFSTPWSRCSRG